MDGSAIIICDNYRRKLTPKHSYKMKKIYLALAAMTLLVLAAGCKKEKEGVYNPDQKIKTIYTAFQYFNNGEMEYEQPKTVSEQWTWKDDHVVSIEYFEDYPDVCATQTLTYDDQNRILSTKLDGRYINATSLCTYGKKYLETMELTMDGQPYITFHFNREKSVITNIVMDVNPEAMNLGKGNKEMQKMLSSMPMQQLLGPAANKQVLKMAEKYAKMAKGNQMVSVTLYLTWDGDNIVSMSGSGMGETMKLDYTYDAKHNPFYNMFGLTGLMEMDMPYMMHGMLSENNPLTISLTVNGITEVDKYNYEYDGKDYPTRVYTEEKESWDGMESRYVSSTYYEYMTK